MKAPAPKIHTSLCVVPFYFHKGILNLLIIMCFDLFFHTLAVNFVADSFVQLDEEMWTRIGGEGLRHQITVLLFLFVCLGWGDCRGGGGGGNWRAASAQQLHHTLLCEAPSPTCSSLAKAFLQPSYSNLNKAKAEQSLGTVAQADC